MKLFKANTTVNVAFYCTCTHNRILVHWERVLWVSGGTSTSHIRYKEKKLREAHFIVGCRLEVRPYAAWGYCPLRSMGIQHFLRIKTSNYLPMCMFESAAFLLLHHVANATPLLVKTPIKSVISLALYNNSLSVRTFKSLYIAFRTFAYVLAHACQHAEVPRQCFCANIAG